MFRLASILVERGRGRKGEGGGVEGGREGGRKGGREGGREGGGGGASRCLGLFLPDTRQERIFLCSRHVSCNLRVSSHVHARNTPPPRNTPRSSVTGVWRWHCFVF